MKNEEKLTKLTHTSLSNGLKSIFLFNININRLPMKHP